MDTFEKFKFRTQTDLKEKIKELGTGIGLSEDLTIFGKTVKINNKIAPNSIAVLPMEGCDCNPDGTPSDLTIRRYRRFFSGGAGLIWFEACAVTSEGKANPLQMMLTRENMDKFKDLLTGLHNLAQKDNGYRPLAILQLTHSGRYSRPILKQAPIIAQHDPYLDARVGIDENYPVVTDDYLDNLKMQYVRSALLAKEAGFDGVDIKACHRYLISELLASHTREGKYGGSFENRIRFLVDTLSEVRKAVGEDFIVSSRVNVYDAHPYPYGFGVSKEDASISDLEEPLELVRRMCKAGVDLLSNSAGNPYYNHPEVTRPFDQATLDGDTPNEHPLVSIKRLFEFTARIQEVAGDVPVIGNGYSWLRHYAPNAGAFNLREGNISMMGMGRSSFAYPDAPKDILNNERMEPKLCCIACSKCTQIMRDHGKTGCVIRDSEVYLPLYRESREAALERENAKGEIL